MGGLFQLGLLLALESVHMALQQVTVRQLELVHVARAHLSVEVVKEMFVLPSQVSCILNQLTTEEIFSFLKDALTRQRYSEGSCWEALEEEVRFFLLPPDFEEAGAEED